MVTYDQRPTGPPPPPPVQQDAARYAHWGRRVLAFVIDVAVVYAPILLAVAAINALGLVDADGDPTNVLGTVATACLGTFWLAFAIVNWIVLDGRGGTIGRRLTGCRLVSLRDGKPIGAGRVLLRNLAHNLDGTPSLGVGYLLPLFTEKRQTIADLLMKTVVVRVR